MQTGCAGSAGPSRRPAGAEPAPRAPRRGRTVLRLTPATSATGSRRRPGRAAPPAARDPGEPGAAGEPALDSSAAPADPSAGGAPALPSPAAAVPSPAAPSLTDGEPRMSCVRQTTARRLDAALASVADAAGLAQEVAMLRASIRRLAQPAGETAEQIKVLAELRHQIEALCTALKTQQALAGDDNIRAAELARVLDDLGDRLGASR
ncbi:MAG: hypothetical protein IT306_22775 [Chloroflexi bacterium]|nr:hypothetical protein [Chloroflexota bacterium]